MNLIPFHLLLVNRLDSFVHGKAGFLVAVGLAVPAIEAWYLCGVDHHVTEATWINARLQGVSPPYSRLSLKEAVYGSTRNPTISKAEEAATRLCGTLPLLEQDFPVGFGMFASEVRGW